MITPETKLISEREIILLRDTMSIAELRKITDKCKKTFGFVDYRNIFRTMGYKHAFNDKWYKIMITKKEFTELVSVHVYGRGEHRRVRLFFDWCNDINKGIGYKYMLKGYGCTKATIIKDAYDILIKEIVSSLYWYEYKEAKTDSERFKVPIVG